MLGSGNILICQEAARILAEDYGVTSDVFSATSFNELARDGLDCERYNMLHPESEQKVPYITEVLSESNDGPTITATDYIKSYGDQVRAYVPGSYKVLGTDGFGRSDSRENLRRHFEVNAHYIVVATLHELAKSGDIKMKVVADAIAKFGIDADKINPLYA